MSAATPRLPSLPLGARAYTLLVALLLPLALLRLGMKGLRNRAYWQRIGERFGRLPAHIGPADVWVHAVSVGEVAAAAVVVEALRRRRPALRVLVTTGTPTGSAAVRERFGASVAHCYCPYDHPALLAPFLRRVRPRLAVLMETELWPNLIRCCRRHQVAVALVNGRLSAASARAYARLPRLSANMLGALNWLGVQSRADARRLVCLGADRTRVERTGSVKFDTMRSDAPPPVPVVLRQGAPADRAVWMAASTHEGEDALLLTVVQRLRARYPDALLVLAPRHPERCNRVGEQVRRAGLSLLRHSQCLRDGAQAARLATAAVYLVDTLGALPGLFVQSDLAFVGGSLVPVGGHNVLEPAALGVPVLTGPHVHNFADICRRLGEAGGLLQVENAEALSRALLDLYAEPARRRALGAAARRFVQANRGAAEQVAERLTCLLEGSAQH